MAKIPPPWHSARVSDRNVYHDNDKCTEDNQIAIYNHISGTGGRISASSAVNWPSRVTSPQFPPPSTAHSPQLDG